MDEVDKIIIHTLQQLDANIETPNGSGLGSFTPELIVRAVSTCLYEIQPNSVLPRTLPAAMAQRFTVATTLAEACQTSGYRGDIGYQTFLYPSSTKELRRLFMFLIEQLPRESSSVLNDTSAENPPNEYERLQRTIREQMRQQLRNPWVPQYARRRHLGCSSQCITFAPQLNLNVPSCAATPRSKELQQYLEQQAPSIFQQTAPRKYDLISSVMHKNDMDRFGGDDKLPEVISLNTTTTTTDTDVAKSTQLLDETSTNLKTTTKAAAAPSHDKETNNSKTPQEQLNEHVNELRLQCEQLLAKRKMQTTNLNTLKMQETQAIQETDNLRSELKLHERTCLVLTEPSENIAKLEALIENVRSKRQTLEQQWQDYRRPMLDKLQTLKTVKQAMNIQNVIELRAIINQIEQELLEKIAAHKKLNETLNSATQNIAPRKEYTRRIHEFIGNIRKQRTDIFKVLDDTRDLQKQLNLVGAQLQRQFNYTEDLLFQSAKHDLHAKKAYKLLANVHANCNELVEFVTLTGNVSKEIRDLEVQIDNEKMKNIQKSLMQISTDIEKFEQHIKELQTEIRTVENEITAG